MSAALNHAVTSWSGTQPGERRHVAVGRRQLGGEAGVPAQPGMVPSGDDDVDVACGVTGRVEDDLDAFVGGDETEAQHGEPAVEPESTPCVVTIEGRNLLDAVGDHRRRRDDSTERRLMDDRRSAGPHDGGLHGGDPGTGERGRDPDAVQPRVVPVDGCRVDDLVHRRHERRVGEHPTGSAEGAGQTEQRPHAAVQEQLELEVDDWRSRRRRRCHRRRKRPASEDELATHVDSPINETGRVAFDLRGDDRDANAVIGEGVGEVGGVRGDPAVASVAFTARG